MIVYIALGFAGGALTAVGVMQMMWVQAGKPRFCRCERACPLNSEGL